MLNVGVIGAGRMGSTHVRLLQAAVSGAQVVAVSDAIAASAERIAGEAGVPTVHADPFDLVRDASVGAVVVASADATHEAFVLACLEAGKPVLCEKPLAPTAEATRRVLEAELAAGRRLVQVGFMRRYDPGYVEMERRLEAGEIGAPLMMHCVHRNPAAHPATDRSERLIVSSAVHEIDLARWLLGEEIVRAAVFAPSPTRHAAGGILDPQLVVLETAGGRLVDVEVFVNARYGYDIRCELVGETGTLELAPPATVIVRGAGARRVEVAAGFEQRFAAAYVQELREWTAALAAGAPAGPSAWDGYAAAAVAEACIESLRSGRPADVAIDPAPALYADSDRPTASR